MVILYLRLCGAIQLIKQKYTDEQGRNQTAIISDTLMFRSPIISPFLAFVCWYAKGKGKLAFMLSILILAVLFNMTFVYGWGYFEALSVLELAVFIIGLTVLRRDTLRSSVLMGTISIVLAFLLDMIIPFHFG